MKNFCFLIMGCCLSLLLQGQTTQILTLGDAINIAIANNYDLKIQQQASQLAQNKVNKANAGLLPTIDAIGTGSYTNNFTEVDLRTFQPEPPIINISESGVETSTVNLGVEANYLLWDGGSGRLRFQLLEGLSEIERAQQAVILNGLVAGIADLYFTILKLQNQENLLQENIALIQERITKIENKREFGKANKLDLLQAQTTLNQDLSSLDNILLTKTNLLLNLKNLINDKSEQTYTVVGELNGLAIPELGTINTAIQNQNPQLKLVKKGIALSEIEVLLAKSVQKPTIAAFANAGYFWQQNDVQQLAKIQNVGGTIGLSVRYNLFDGGLRKMRIANAQIARDIENQRWVQLQDQLQNKAQQELAKMALIKAQLERETINQITYEENYQKVAERFQLGKLPEITLREAQLALTNSKLTMANLRADFELSTVRLQQLMGEFVGL